MASPNLQAVKLEGTEAHIKKILRHLDGRATVVVRGAKTELFVAVPGSELGWLDKVAHDMGCKKLEIPELPEHEKAPCGILTTDVRHHKARCKECLKLKPEKPAPVPRTTRSRNGKAQTVVKVEGLHDLTLEGLVTFMKNRMEDALALASEYDTVLKALEKIPELEDKLGQFQGELDSHRNALKYFANIK